MARFTFEARDWAGRDRERTVDAPTVEEATAKLRAEGFTHITRKTDERPRTADPNARPELLRRFRVHLARWSPALGACAFIFTYRRVVDVPYAGGDGLLAFGFLVIVAYCANRALTHVADIERDFAWAVARGEWPKVEELALRLATTSTPGRGGLYRAVAHAGRGRWSEAKKLIGRVDADSVPATELADSVVLASELSGMPAVHRGALRKAAATGSQPLRARLDLAAFALLHDEDLKAAEAELLEGTGGRHGITQTTVATPTSRAWRIAIEGMSAAARGFPEDGVAQLEKALAQLEQIDDEPDALRVTAWVHAALCLVTAQLGQRGEARVHQRAATPYLKSHGGQWLLDKCQAAIRNA